MEAFSRMAADYPGTHLRIVGSGSLQDELERMAGQEQLKGKVDFAGTLSREEVREVMQESDAFVFPSRFESMSYTLLEAMACGLACIATDVGGNRDLLVDGASGILVPPSNTLALESAMRSVAGSLALRRQLSRAARKGARQYTVEKMLHSTRGLYLSLLAAHSLRQD
jgi:glycosyltransferase involved in cell wall biosynthesis